MATSLPEFRARQYFAVFRADGCDDFGRRVAGREDSFRVTTSLLGERRRIRGCGPMSPPGR